MKEIIKYLKDYWNLLTKPLPKVRRRGKGKPNGKHVTWHSVSPCGGN